MSAFRGRSSGSGSDSIPPAFRGGPSLPVGRIITIGVVILVACGVLFLLSTAIQRVDPGYTAIVVDYSVGQQEPGQALFRQVPTGSFFFVNPLTQRVAKYPLGQQTLSMVRRQSEGRVVGDDSVECNDITGVRINIDSSTLWRVIPESAGKLYFLRPDMPLVDSPGNDIEDQVVRREIRSAITYICGTMSYEAIYGIDRLNFADRVKALLANNLASQYIAVDSFLAGEVYLRPELADAIAAKVNAQQQAQQAAFLKQKAENEALASVATAEGQKKVRILQGEAEAEVRVLEANAEATYIQLINQQLADAPQFIQYIFSNRWNGTLPSTLITDGNTTPLLQLPTTPISPTTTTTTPPGFALPGIGAAPEPGQ